MYGSPLMEADFLFITESSAEVNLLREGIDKGKIFFVGNIMIDTLLLNLQSAKDLNILEQYNLKEKKYALMTIHRPSNVDDIASFRKIIKIINYTQERIKVFFPIHPRTTKRLREFDLEKDLSKSNLILSEPIGYLEFLNLMINSKFILTDSGGIQEEASYLHVPILTLRENTERPITVEKGTNQIVGTDFELIKTYIDEIFKNKYKNGQQIEKWDGKTAERIVNIIQEKLY